MMFNLFGQTTMTESRLEWKNLPESWWVFLFLLIAGCVAIFVFWTYLRESSACPKPVRIFLAVLRLTVVALLIFAFLEPVRTNYKTILRKPTVVLMADSSQSMATKDGWKDEKTAASVAKSLGVEVDKLRAEQPSRIEVTNQLLARENRAFIEKLREKANVKVMTIGEKVAVAQTFPAHESPTATKPNETEVATEVIELPKVEANGKSSDLASAIKSVLAGTPPQSVWLFSDGQHTTPEKPIEVAQEAADKKVPINTVGIGDPYRSKNVRIKESHVLAKARPDEPFTLEVVLAGQKLAGETVHIEVNEHDVQDADGQLGQPRSIYSADVSVTDDSWLGRERIQHQISKPGKYAYTVKVTPIEGEDNVEDNQVVTSVMEVTNEKVKVLLIAGSSSWEYIVVRRLLQRDPAINLSCWLQTLDPERVQDGDEQIAELPRSFEELAKYNAIFLFDPNPDEFDGEWVKNLKRFVEQKAGGLLFMAGQAHTSTFLSLPNTEGIKDLLPVKFDSEADTELAKLLSGTNSTNAPFQVVGANIDHQIMSFSPERSDNMTLWQRMPGMFWTYPAQSPKPTSKVLLEHSDMTLATEGSIPRPLMVAGKYGAGNTLYVGFTGTWRWRKVGLQAEYFDRFWIQVVRYLVNTRSVQGLRRGTIDLGREQFELGDRVELSARILDSAYEPVTEEQFSGKILAPNNETIPVSFRRVDGQPGQYEAIWNANLTGQFQVLLDLPGVTTETAIEPVMFRVDPPTVEARATWMNEPLLREIATTSGGKYVTVDELMKSAEELPAVTSAEPWREPPKLVWDLSTATRYWFFAIPIVLLAIEWSIRKWSKLL